ncbi:hypothetical protein SAMN04515620_11367 [Collimonas sp. OK607]|uniref:hypothetical protein n=1 Tax=Collimonas sp. OK607 TaxID=1798194 RepID=UPI0008DF5991|nr:hypothetical protein [Collimonas sp. OK607]SFB02954.1 hypothetical protein SAMN04515620_11367 [Collimonas sp. OK607]
MKTLTLYQALQAKLGAYSGEHLTTTLRYQDQYGDTVEKPLLDATLDEMAFAIQTLSVEGSVIYRRRSALENLYTLARDRGCLGADTIGAIAAEVTK